MQENFEAEQEGGAKSAAQEKQWRVPFVVRGTVTVRAETPEEAADRAMDLSTEELACAGNEVRMELAEEAGL
jgi:hypothetical protein